MRNAIKVTAASAAMMLMTIGAGFAAPVSGSTLSSGAAFETGVLQVQYGGHCERLRWKCEHKYELGREGEGLCQRYREECGGRVATASACGGRASTNMSAAKKAKATAAATARSAAGASETPMS